MWIWTAIKILVGSALFGVFWWFINYFIYYFVYSFKFVFSIFDFVFKVLWTNDSLLQWLHYFILWYLTYYVVGLVKKFIF